MCPCASRTVAENLRQDNVFMCFCASQTSPAVNLFLRVPQTSLAEYLPQDNVFMCFCAHLELHSLYVILRASRTSLAEYLQRDNVFMCFCAYLELHSLNIYRRITRFERKLYTETQHILYVQYISLPVSHNVCHLITKKKCRSRDSSVIIVTGCGLDDRGSIPGRDKKYFSTPQRPDRLWVPSSLLSNRYRALFPRGLSGLGVKLSAQLHLMPWSRTVELYLHFPCIFTA
jgi:hypothetical protein